MQEKFYPIIRRIHTIYTSPDGETASVYGMEVYTRDGMMVFADVDESAAAVEELISRLRREGVEICHFRDVVEDFIHR